MERGCKVERGGGGGEGTGGSEEIKCRFKNSRVASFTNVADRGDKEKRREKTHKRKKEGI